MDFTTFPPFALALEAASALLSALSSALAPLVGASSAALAVVLLTLAVRAALVPLGAMQVRAEVQRRRLAPRLAELQRRHKKNPERLQRETLELYRSEGVSPFAGMLPALAQLPFVSTLYLVFVSPTIGGHPNGLLVETFADVPLGRTAIQVLGSPTVWPDVLVPAVLVVLISVTAWFTRRQSLRMMASQPPAAQASPMAGMMRGMTWLSFATAVIAVFVPLAAALYLTVSTAWTLTERTLLRARTARKEPRAV